MRSDQIRFQLFFSSYSKIISLATIGEHCFISSVTLSQLEIEKKSGKSCDIWFVLYVFQSMGGKNLEKIEKTVIIRCR